MSVGAVVGTAVPFSFRFGQFRFRCRFGVSVCRCRHSCVGVGFGFGVGFGAFSRGRHVFSLEQSCVFIMKNIQKQSNKSISFIKTYLANVGRHQVGVEGVLGGFCGPEQKQKTSITF